MPRPSSVDKLPEEVRSLIGQLRGMGWTIDQIKDHLEGLLDRAPSRSALGRHIHGMDKIAETMRRSRQVAEALAKEMGDAPGSKAASVAVELLHGVVMKMFMRSADGEGDEINPNGQAALDGDPEGVMMLAKALDHLGRANKSNVDFLAAAEKRAFERAQREAVKAVEAVSKEKGLTANTVAAIKSKIFGVQQ